MIEETDERYRVLRWVCLRCGASACVPMPGFWGTGLSHYEDGKTPCGPLVAAPVEYLRMRPGAAREDIEAAARAALPTREEPCVHCGQPRDGVPGPACAEREEPAKDMDWHLEPDEVKP